MTLEGLSDAYLQEITRLANNKKIADNLRDGFPHPYLLTDAIEFVLKAGDDPLQHKRAILVGDIFVGLVGLSQDTKNSFIAEIGYWIGEEYWGKGYATNAIKLMVNFGFKELGLSKIYAKVIAGNLGSVISLERSGFIFKESIDEVCNSTQKDSATLLYEIIPEKS